ncbi:S-adenosyl-L-methionine-dependent methyltransferase [Nemania sp. FL0916]|nr:S-adenosyl-L-methionine-dependent methyltransferase [Nemania sp. FL0916]
MVETDKIEVTLSGVAETLLIPLLGRAMDAAAQQPLLGDSFAGGVVRRLDYDFAKLPVQPVQAAGIAMRTQCYDRWATAFLAARPHATVLQLGCGLDSRNQRVDWGADTRWIDADLPGVVALRRRLLPTSLPGRDYQLVAADVTSDAWLAAIPKDRPVLVIMEGLVSYLPPDDATGLLRRLVDGLGEGELHFDCMNTTVLAANQKDSKGILSRTGSTFQWAVDDLHDIEKIHTSLHLLEAIRYLEAPGVEQLPLLNRLGHYMLSWVPSLRDSVRFVRFGFSKTHDGDIDYR